MTTKTAEKLAAWLDVYPKYRPETVKCMLCDCTKFRYETVRIYEKYLCPDCDQILDDFYADQHGCKEPYSD